MNKENYALKLDDEIILYMMHGRKNIKILEYVLEEEIFKPEHPPLTPHPLPTLRNSAWYKTDCVS